MTDKRIKEYLEKGGRLFQVTKMDSYRDGGTKVIETTYGGDKKFFIHMDNNTIHTYYPCTDESLLQDELLKEYIIERINTYVMRFNEQSHRQSRWLLDIILNNKQD
jgi:hypothetical protein